MKLRLSLLLGATLLVLGTVAAACEAGEPAASNSEDDPEYLLASIDAGEPLSVDDPSISAYADRLDSLDEKCEEERSLIGDQAVRATQLLAEEGVSVTVLEALEGFDESIPGEFPVFSCAEIGALWTTLVTGQ